MKSTMKFLAILAALSLTVSTVAGCSQNQPATESSDSAPTPSTESTTQAEPPTTGDTMPFVTDGSVELTYAGPDSWYPPASYTQDLPVWQEVEKRTGVKIKWEVMPADQYDAAMQTRLAAGSNLPDIMAIPPLWGGDVVKLAKDGIIIPLKELIAKNGPNILEMYKKYPVVEKIHTAPDGEIYNFTEVFVEGNEVAPKSFIVRQDWLDKLGISAPVTLDDWYNMLKAFKEKDPNGNGKPDEIPLTDHMGVYNGGYAYFGSAFGLPSPAVEFWAGEDGKVKHLYSSPEFKELLTFLNKLYKEGLMDPQYSTNKDEAKVDAMVSKDIVGVAAHFAGVDVRWDNLLKNAGNADVNYTLTLPPTGPNGEKPQLAKRNPTGMEYGITKSCKNPDIAVKWIDYISASDEGVILTHFGIEGQSYEKDSNGRPKFNDWTLKNPDGLDPFSAVRSLGAFPSLFDTQTKEFMSQTIAPKTIAACDKLFPYMVEPFPKVLATVEESNRTISLQADMKTYIEETLQKFVMGTEPLENFDKFVKQLQGMGVEELLGIKQAQYDRFMAK